MHKFTRQLVLGTLGIILLIVVTNFMNNTPFDTGVITRLALLVAGMLPVYFVAMWLKRREENRTNPGNHSPEAYEYDPESGGLQLDDDDSN